MGASVWHAGGRTHTHTQAGGVVWCGGQQPTVLLAPHPHPLTHSPIPPCPHPPARGLGVAGFSSQQIPLITRRTHKKRVIKKK